MAKSQEPPMYRAFIEFTFQPDGHDESMFEGLSETNRARLMRDLFVQNIEELINNGDLHEGINVEEMK
jgi:hypothetical protein